MRFKAPLLLIFFLFNSCSVQAKISDHYRKIINKTEGHSFGQIDFIYLINLEHRPEKYKQSVDELAKYNISPFRFPAINGWTIKHTTIHEIGLKFDNTMRGGGMGSYFLWEDGKEYCSHELLGKEGRTYFTHCMSRGPIGCLMSHVSILKDAYDSGYKLIWIMEDDVEVIRHPSLLLSYIAELDNLVGRGNWDLLYTDSDYRGRNGQHVPCSGTDYRPDIDTRDQERYKIHTKISKNIKKVGSRFSTTSMIWTRAGLKKYLDHIEKNGMFLPIDMDIHLAQGINVYGVVEDVVTNRTNSISDNARNLNNEKTVY